MKTLTPAALALLATRQFYLVDLFTFTLIDGTVLLYCSGDKNITVGATVYSCGGTTGPYFKRQGDNSKITWKCGLEASTLEFTADPGPSGKVNGVDFSTACTIGLFWFADCLVERAIMPTYGDTSPGKFTIFNGLVGPVSGGRAKGERFTVNSYTSILNLDMPRNLFQPACVNSLYDTACTLIKNNFKTSATASAGSTVSSINATISKATGYFDLGTIKFTSGPNNGTTRGVKTYTNGSPSNLVIIPPLVNAPTIGDGFDVFPGCDKTQVTCVQKFNNLGNFRGQPGVPTPETAV